MKLALYRRHHGIHNLKKEIKVDCNFNDVYLGEDNINEELLLSVIPKDFLLDKPKNILLVVEDEDG